MRKDQPPKRTESRTAANRFIYLLAILCFVSMSGFAQINLKIKDQTIRTILKSIEKQTDNTFFYNEGIQDLDKITSLNASNLSVEETLKLLLKDTNIAFKKENKTFVLAPKEKFQNNPVTPKSGKVSGQVTDIKGEPVIGASIKIAGATAGTITDMDGKFSIEAPTNGNIIVSYIGYTTSTVAVLGKSVLKIILSDDTKLLDEVVVVGFGTQKKANLTGAVSQVKMENVLGDRPVTDIKSALQGTIPGLQVTGGSVPGSSKTFNIRGITSINAVNGPLVLIDNVPGAIDLVNPEDIESVSVLKDAASAAIYGARAAFGVILVTTKQAKKNQKVSINYKNNFSFDTSINRPEQASVEQFLQTYIDYSNSGKYYAQNQDMKKWLGFVQEYNADPAGFQSKYPDSYLQDGRFVPKGESIYYYLKANESDKAMLDKFGFKQTHNLSASGGSETISYRVSVGYTDQDGALYTNKDSYKRHNINSHIKGDVNKWLSQAFDISYAKSNRSYVENGNVFRSSIPVFSPEGSMPLSTDLNGLIYPVRSAKNTLILCDPSHWIDESTRIYSQTFFHPFKGFEGILEYTHNQQISDYKNYKNKATVLMIEHGFENNSPDQIYTNNKTSVEINAINAYATYAIKLFDKHNFKLMTGYSQETRDYELLKANRNQMINIDQPSFAAATGTPALSDIYLQYAIRSVFFRFNYDFDDKYLLEVNGRYDGSSKFPSKTRLGFFPSASAGWQLGRENFMKWTHSWLNDFKLRGSYGKLGNQDGVEEYDYTPTMQGYLASWIVNGITPTTLTPPDLVRDNYTWENVETTDLGFDLNVLNNRLTTTFDWYVRNNTGMLAPGSELPKVVGAPAPLQNIANLQTKGWEVAIQWRDKIGKWRYGFGVNVYDSKTKITKYDNLSDQFYDATNNNNYRVGMQLGEIWGYQTDGFYTVDDFIDVNTWALKPGVPALNGYAARPGDIKFKDIDDNGVISIGDNTVYKPGDRKIIGNTTARYQYGANANVGWKGFDLSVFVQGTAKRDYWLGGDLMFGPQIHYGNVYSNQLDYWKPSDRANGDFTAVNPNAYYPRIYDENKNAGSNYRTQTKYLQNASYLRIKNITLSYTIPQNVLKPIGLASGKVFFSGENMFTFSNLPKGIDPERIGWGYPFYASYSLGLSFSL